ncbi:MAG: hypothetical protein AB7S70_06690 [Hyphomicrobium sp.]|uniref:hypothetical protein n=1 Tax=Hyphomicrobium sp. TaxID=82 RepID=UPI003D1438D9
MISNDLLLLILVAAGAFYAGYQVGRFKALAELGGRTRAPEDNDPQPLPGPHFDAPPARPRGTAPPASAGNDGGRWTEAGAGGSGRTPPRRSTKPPPAAAGLMGTGAAENSDKRQK